jgi:hypothetical protein
MGRPPIGKVAMTSAERTRCWASKQHAAEVERLQSRIRELEAELTRERARKAPSGIPRTAVPFAPERADEAPPPMPPPGTDWVALEQAVEEERKAQRAAAKAARVAEAVSLNEMTMEALQAAKQQAQAELAETRKHLSAARKQLRQARTEIRRADRALNARSQVIMPREDYNKIINCLHPDRYGNAADRRRHEQALQIVTALKNAKQIVIR